MANEQRGRSNKGPSSAERFEYLSLLQSELFCSDTAQSARLALMSKDFVEI
jgi:hypothetical protein